jgi:hypothetical protein
MRLGSGRPWHVTFTAAGDRKSVPVNSFQTEGVRAEFIDVKVSARKRILKSCDHHFRFFHRGIVGLPGRSGMVLPRQGAARGEAYEAAVRG